MKIIFVWVMIRYTRTARRFRASQKHKENKKVYYRKHLSKSQRRLQVTGGKNLRESGVYTPQFCLAVIDMWEEARELGHNAFSSTDFSQDHQSLWNMMFSHSSVSNETWGRIISTCFRFCLKNPVFVVSGLGTRHAKNTFFRHKKTQKHKESGRLTDGLDRTLGVLLGTIAVLDDWSVRPCERKKIIRSANDRSSSAKKTNHERDNSFPTLLNCAAVCLIYIYIHVFL